MRLWSRKHADRSIITIRLRGCNSLGSFSVPYDLSMGGSREPWAEAFLSDMHERWARCKPAWGGLRMEVTECYPQAIVL